MRNKCEANHVLYRDGVYYYVRRVPYDLTSYYDVKRLCFSLKTKSLKAASQQQVREKVYTGSSDAWRKFEPYLNGLFDELEQLI